MTHTAHATGPDGPPDLPEVSRLVRRLMKRCLPGYLDYHDISHTFDDVLPAAERLGALEGVDGIDLVLLRTAAVFHDLGFIERYHDHEEASADLARRLLPAHGYGAGQIEVVTRTLMATRLPHEPVDLLGRILADADLDVLGRDDFLARNRRLRAELSRLRGPVDDAVWCRQQLGFMVSHRYFTPSARALRAAGKRVNIARLQEQLARHQRERES